MQCIGLYINRQRSCEKVARDLIAWLQEQGKKVYLLQGQARDLELPGQSLHKDAFARQIELAIVLGEMAPFWLQPVISPRQGSPSWASIWGVWVFLPRQNRPI